MKHLVILLYVRYSKFLCHAMTWYQSKWGRFKAAMDQNYYSREVQDKVNGIKDVVREIEREASLENQGILGETHEAVTHLEHMVAEIRRQNVIADQNHNLSNMDLTQKLDCIWLALGEMARNLATDTVTRQLYNSQLSIAQGSASGKSRSLLAVWITGNDNFEGILRVEEDRKKTYATGLCCFPVLLA